MKKALAKSANVFWLCLAVLIILTAVFVQVGRLMAPLVKNNQEYITQIISDEIGSDVVVNSINARWNQLSPSIAVDSLKIYSSQDSSVSSTGSDDQHVSQSSLSKSSSPSVEIESIALELDLLQSLFQGRLIWNEISLANAKIELKQQQNGNWQLSGIQTAARRNKQASIIDDPVDIFLLADRLQVNDVSLMLESYEGKTLELSVTDIEFQNQQDFHRLVANINVDDQSVANAVLEAHGDPRSDAERDVKGFIQLVDFPMAELKNYITNFDVAIEGLDTEQDTLNINVWLSSQKRHVYTFNGDFELALTETKINDIDVPTSVSTRFGGSLNTVPADFEFNIQVQDSSVQWQQKALNLELLDIAFTDSTWRIKTPSIFLPKLTQSARLFSENNPKLLEILDSLNLQGELTATEIRIPTNDIKQTRLLTVANSVSVGAFQGAPQLTGVNGFISAGISGGEITLDSNNGFSMWFQTAFNEPMVFDSAHGRVAWRLSPEDNKVSIFSDVLMLDGDIGTAIGVASVDLPWIAKSRPSNLDLFVGLTNSDVSFRSQLLPKSLEPDLKAWLDQSIKSGDISASGFVYRGRLSPGNNEITTQLWIELEQGELAYHDEWPALTHIDGRIELNSTVVSAQVSSAQLWETQISKAELSVERINDQTMLAVKGNVVGPGNDGIQLLTTTPIREQLGSVFDEWTLSTPFNGSVDLSIPLTSGEQEGYQVVDLSLKPGTLAMTDLDLSFDSLEGLLLFDSRTGLHSDGIDFKVWDQPASAIIVSEGYTEISASASNTVDEQEASTRILFSGLTKITDVQQWLQSPELLFADGETAFHGELFLPGEKDSTQPVTLTVRSELEGVSIDLPEPFNKSPEIESPFAVTLEINDDINLYRLSLSDWLNGRLVSKKGVLEQVDIAINDQPHLKNKGIHVHGLMPRFNLDEWLDVLDQYEIYQDQVVSEGDSELDVGFEFALYNSQIKSFEIPNANVTGKQLSDRWSIEFNSDLAAGFLELPLSDTEKMTASFNHLYLPSSDDESESEAIDPLADIDLSAIPPAYVSIEELKLGDDHYGTWSFELSPNNNRLVVDNIVGNVHQLNFTGIDSDGARLVWESYDGQMRTHFLGKVDSNKIDDALVAFDQPKVLESSDAVFDVDLSWPGSPAAIEMTALEGSVQVDMEHGRFIRAAEGGGDAILRLVALFNFDSWARRLRLGVSDLVESGMAFDRIDGKLEFKNGDLLIPSPIIVKAPSSSLSYAGNIDLINEELDTTLVATLPVGGNLTLIAALAGGLPAAAGVYVASKLFKKQVNKVASLSYKISGTWEDPKSEFIRLFDDNAAKKAGKKADEEASNASPESDPKALLYPMPVNRLYDLLSSAPV
ncbi:YhdP family phospholipid transporter [Sessilibacter corallicola]|uniref:YhdP family protein n=1 Tax=Sessilibacter corallicola TaxID=2904075 RepID=A0ABQ0A3J3_9GAMM